MKVSDIKDVSTQYIQQYQRNESAAQAAEKQAAAASKTTEKVDLSTMARDIQKAKVEVSKLPDVREEKVREVKDQVDKGTYNVSGEQIANKMVGESIIDLFA